MEFELNKAISILERTPTALKTLLEGLSSDWTVSNEGENTWSPYDIIGHFIHGELTDWIPRAKIILSNSSDKKFELFDRFAQEQNSVGKTMDDLLNEFEELRTNNLRILKDMNLSESDLSKEGIHPEFGTVTLRQLLSTWTVHDLGHIAQLSRVMAKQYKQEVGPWSQYLRILD